MRQPTEHGTTGILRGTDTGRHFGLQPSPRSQPAGWSAWTRQPGSGAAPWMPTPRGWGRQTPGFQTVECAHGTGNQQHDAADGFQYPGFQTQAMDNTRQRRVRSSETGPCIPGCRWRFRAPHWPVGARFEFVGLCTVQAAVSKKVGHCIPNTPWRPQERIWYHRASQSGPSTSNRLLHSTRQRASLPFT